MSNLTPENGYYWEIHRDGVYCGTVPDSLRYKYIDLLIKEGLTEPNGLSTSTEFRLIQRNVK